MDENKKQQQDLELTYSVIAKKMLAGASEDKCVKYLMKKGVPEEFAAEFVESVSADTESFKKSPNYRNYLVNMANQRLITGVIWLVMGGVIRSVSNTPAAAGLSAAMSVFGLAFILFGLYSWIGLLIRK